VERDPDNANYQRDLGISHERLGDVNLDAGRTAEAAEFYQQGLAVAERLVQVDPDNVGYQRAMSVSYDKLRDLFGELPDHEQQ
jgi:Flp pilus assembly protein TadD